MKEALFYDKLKEKKVQCRLCPWECIIFDGKLGVCGVRKNENGVLYSLIYGIISSMAMDPIEKKPLYNFYPGTRVFSVGTFGCNMQCGHCQNRGISRASGQKAAESGQKITPEELIAIALKEKAPGIAFTYNEPTIWFEYTLDCAKLAKEKGLYTVYVTNGYINAEPLDAVAPYIDAFSLDVKAFTPQAYKKLCKVVRHERVLEAAERVKNKWKKHLEIVTNVVPTINDDEKQLQAIAEWIKDKLGADTPWHVTRFFPYHEFKNLLPTPVETLELAREIGKDSGLTYVYIGNV